MLNLARWTPTSTQLPAWTRSTCWGTLRRLSRVTATFLSSRWWCISEKNTLFMFAAGGERNDDIETSFWVDEPHPLWPHHWHARLPCGGWKRRKMNKFETDLYLRSLDNNERNWYSQMLCSKDPIVKFPLSQEWLKMWQSALLFPCKMFKRATRSVFETAAYQYNCVGLASLQDHSSY